MKTEKKKSGFINTCALLFILTIVAAILTWVIPAGEFDYAEVDGIKSVVAGSYHAVEQNPQGPWDVLMATCTGFGKASVMMTMIMFIGAAIFILNKTGSIEIAFNKVAAGKKTNDALIVLLVMAFMTIGGATGVLANATVALVPIGILVSTAMGLDRASGFIMVYLGAYSGFNVGWAVAATLGVAQPLADLPLFSGLYVRLGIHLVNFILTYVFIVHYIKGVRKDPTRSLNYTAGMNESEYMGTSALSDTDSTATHEKMNVRHAINLLATCGAVVTVVVGTLKFSWGNNQLGATFLLLAVFLGLFNGYGINGTANLFLQGCASMLSAAFIVGFANGISVILASGNILNTIVYGISIPMSFFGPVIGASVMFVGNIFINLFIPSGSGQAAAVMPIMVPVADLAGITRQVAVQAFQFGDGFSNCLFPTAGTLMGSLGIACIGWNRYAKWFLPLILSQVVLAIAALTILQSIGWTGI